MVEIKLFLQIQSIKYRASQYGKHDCSAHNKRNIDCRNLPHSGSSQTYGCIQLKIFSWLGNVFLIETILWRCDEDENVQILDLWYSERDRKMNRSSYWSQMTIMKWPMLGVATDHLGLGMIRCLLKPMFWVTKLKTSIPWST